MWTAVLAAYLLVVQSILSAYALGALAAPRQPDASGFVICTLHGFGAQPEDDGQQDPHAAYEHCKWACSILPATLPPPGMAADAAHAPTPGQVAFVRPAIPVSPSRPEGSPGNPRAPPARG